MVCRFEDFPAELLGPIRLEKRDWNLEVYDLSVGKFNSNGQALVTWVISPYLYCPMDEEGFGEKEEFEGAVTCHIGHQRTTCRHPRLETLHRLATINPRLPGRFIAQKLLGCLPVEWGARVKVLAQGLSLKTEGFGIAGLHDAVFGSCWRVHLPGFHAVVEIW